jgi:two-component system OmpR family response regulator
MHTLHVLVVDENPHARALVRMVLQDVGAEVRECDDGQTALDALQAWPADVVIADDDMAPMSGAQFVQTLRAREAGARRTPVVMMAGAGQTGAAAADCAADAWVAKPVRAGALLGRVEAAIEAAARTFAKLEPRRARRS